VLAGTADQTDAATREACVYAAQRAGLTLNDEQFAQLLESAPYALGMVQRLRRDHRYANEPANVFRFPAGF
jgi:aspartyl-tRNA(Asn)/glutamyl-tRNA(Gln) amidotransferase subunit A